MNIPDEAVEAAAKAVYGGDHLDGSIQRDAWLRDFRIALEAAAPWMMGKALKDAADSLDGPFSELRAAQGKSFDWLCGIADAEEYLRTCGRRD